MVLRAGLIGLGMMGRNHARVLQSVDGIELRVVADPLGDTTGAVRTGTVVDTVDALLDHELDICVVACPTEDHERVGLALADRGVHALVEKPLALDLPAARRLAAAFDAAGLVGAVGHIERSNAAIRSLRTRLLAGEIGEVFQVATRRIGPFPDRIRDVGVVKDLATHDLDLSAWVGGSRYKTIAARTVSKAGREHEDLVAATGVLDDGTVTSHLVNWLTPFKERLVVATGERGCLIADTLLADLTLYKNGSVPVEWDSISGFRGVSEGDVIRFAIPKPEPLRVQLEHFRDAVLGRPAEIVTMSEGMAAVAVADAAIESARTGTALDVEQDLP
ncbi:MAG: Gfo/Idh/MocA family oxidoreductase [Ilumatobacter sp.]|uniref:Gfo/Idh/MocA family protein n=1 Tax=Ilumatobacter sp. TaxID=1967498 RepID=UPI0026250AF8|nr:Gfo/Idh/MocA family oxidoreductase [Ilumatobacter sp.]MDJ0768348.1 Gfo/Idh/MocA family oxidoreductase [Ilumatobacter sp.]